MFKFIMITHILQIFLMIMDNIFAGGYGNGRLQSVMEDYDRKAYIAILLDKARRYRH